MVSGVNRIVVFLLLLWLPDAMSGAMPVRAAQAGALEKVAPMQTPRAAHTATPLSDGRVFVAGGCTSDSCSLGPAGATTELFDLDTASFIAGPEMVTPRVSHAAVNLLDGRVLLLGGWGLDGPLATTEIYDPVTDTMRIAAEMSTPRADAIVALLPDGRVLVAGGSSNEEALASAEIYDPVLDTFSPTGAMTTPRTSHVGATLPDGRVLLVGGEDASETVLASAEIYDPQTGKFSATGSLQTARYKHAATTLSDGSVLVVGGSDKRDFAGKLRTLETYDPATGQFSPAGELTETRFKLTGTVVPLADGRALIAGGGQHVELYTGTSGTDMVQPSLPASFSFATATLTRDGMVLITGGYDDSLSVTSDAWFYLPSSVSRPPSPDPVLLS